jgi:oxygen-independent coproporphyrinogen-3 oxidase
MSIYEHIDIDLLRRYNEPGPRYTSYPTAPVFSESFGARDYESEIRATNQRGTTRPLSLYAHLPFCDELCYFCGCTMIVTKKPAKKQLYLDYLFREIDQASAMVADTRRVEQLHWGGGTPTDNTPEQIEALAAHLRRRFDFVPEEEGEFSCEIDPRGLTREHLEALRRSGFNRISMGVQDFNETVQKAVNRIQPEAMTRQVVEWCRELGFQSVNLDFIYGLPHQTVESFEDTIDRLIEILPDRLAMFNFAYVPWMKKHHEQLIDEKAMPGPEERLRILKMTIEKLSAAGYVYIGMDHFARPEDELSVAQKNGTLQRNFQGYSTKAGCDLYAFGMSAISQLERVYAQNFKGLSDYYAAVDEGRLPTRAGYALDDDDLLRREVIMRIMCHSVLDTRDVSATFGIDFDEYFAPNVARLQRFVDEGLVVLRDGAIEVTGMGRLVIRNIAMCFDRYLDDLRSDKPIFSRTV